MANMPERRLDSWKEIASYLRRGIRTVQRWEREEGLPVHRLSHAERGSVYANRDEVAAWWESRRRTTDLTARTEVSTPSEPRLERVTDSAAATFSPALSSDGRLPRQGVSQRRWIRHTWPLRVKGQPAAIG